MYTRRQFLLESLVYLATIVGCVQNAAPTSTPSAAPQATATPKPIVYSDGLQRQPPTTVKPTTAPPPPTKKNVRLEDYPDFLESASTPYGGTLPNRIYNIELASAKLDLTSVAPGEVFSLNKALGEISSRTGYKAAYKIAQGNQEITTISGDGGGICQLSTTLFQAVYWAGINVIERNWHKYWIPRYGNPPKGMVGLDATIDQAYDESWNLVQSVDFRFKNDTGAPVLIRSKTAEGTLTVSLYGRDPGWNVKSTDPTGTSTEPAVYDVQTPETEMKRIKDTTIQPGTAILIEHADNGFTAAFVRTVKSSTGKIVSSQKFISKYQPSQNICASPDGTSYCRR